MHPSPFQKQMLWAAITTLSFVAIGAAIFFVGRIVLQLVSFLQPVLIPVAVAAVLAYLLDPVVGWLERRRFSRTRAVVTVFAAFLLLLTGLLVTIAPTAWKQGARFVHDLPGYAQRTQDLVNKTIDETRRISKLPIFQRDRGEAAEADVLTDMVGKMVDDGIAEVQRQLPAAAVSIGKFLQRSVGGFLGVFGTLLSLVLVPIFLFFFLREGPAIASHWSDYLPLRASPLKSEIVSLLTEINSYLINFFRGQLLVSISEGALVATGLMILGVDFALVLGMMGAILGIVPYLGVILTWIPAVVIAAAQFGDWWHPLWVTLIFLLVNNISGILIAPKIVGDSVGLHPLTVILSVLAWSLIVGGLLGAILAVPLTATLKVVLKRYFWDRPAAPG